MYDGEICKDCGLPASHGIGVTFWNAPNELWNLVMGGPDATDDPGGVLCCACFWRRCREQDIYISWRAVEYGVRGEAKPETPCSICGSYGHFTHNHAVPPGWGADRKCPETCG